jgi:hypothetical protein
MIRCVRQHDDGLVEIVQLRKGQHQAWKAVILGKGWKA